MANKEWYDRFMDALYERYPKKNKLVVALMDLLSLEREAAYRRLRRDITFTINEVVKISSAWNISLDGIIGISSGQIPFLMRPFNYIAPSEYELKILQNIIQTINELKDFPDTEFMDICNKLPRQLISGFDYLNQFCLFKWNYTYGKEKKDVPFSQIIISEEKNRLTADFHQAIKNVPKTSFIFDRLIFDNLVNEILYFHSIQMITDYEKALLKKDLYDLLDYLSKIAANGCYPETKNKVNLYVSRLNISTNYTYTRTNHASICFVHVFDKFEIYTYDPEMAANFIEWMQLKKRSSIQISEVDKKSRIDFFTKQKQIVDLL